MFVSELVGLSVYSLDDGKNLGYVLNVLFDSNFKGVDKFLIANDEDDFLITTGCGCVVRVTEQCVFLGCKTDLEIVEEQAEYAGAINSRAVCIDGGEGVVKDVELAANFSVKNVVLWGGELIAAKKCLCFGGDTLIYCKKPFKMLNGESSAKTAVVVKALDQKVPPVIKPIDFSKLIGRKLDANLVSSNGEILAKRGQVITESIIAIAKKHAVLAKLLQ